MSIHLEGETRSLASLIQELRARFSTSAADSRDAWASSGSRLDWSKTIDRLREANDEFERWCTSSDSRDIATRSNDEQDRCRRLISEVNGLLSQCENIISACKQGKSVSDAESCFALLEHKTTLFVAGPADSLRFPTYASYPHAAHTYSMAQRSSPLASSASPVPANSHHASPASYNEEQVHIKQEAYVDGHRSEGGSASHLRKDSHIAAQPVSSHSNGSMWHDSAAPRPSFDAFRPLSGLSSFGQDTKTLPPLHSLHASPHSNALSSPQSTHSSLHPSEAADGASLDRPRIFAAMTPEPVFSPIHNSHPLLEPLHPPLALNGPSNQLPAFTRGLDWSRNDWQERRPPSSS